MTSMFGVGWPLRMACLLSIEAKTVTQPAIHVRLKHCVARHRDLNVKPLRPATRISISLRHFPD